MKALICNNCGSNDFNIDNGIYICNYCGTKFLNSFTDNCTTPSWDDTKKNYDQLSSQKINSKISIQDDIERLFAQCKKDPSRSDYYLNLILDIDPDNQEALNLLKKKGW